MSLKIYIFSNLRVEFVKIALEYQPLNLGQGLPDDLVPNYVIDSLSEVLKDPNASLQQYTRGFGNHQIHILYTLFEKSNFKNQILTFSRVLIFFDNFSREIKAVNS